uniref:RCC1 domain-containing protein n=1 Tax=Thermus caliditerrae TaxID=1330700 RepID=UPI0034DD6D90
WDKASRRVMPPLYPKAAYRSSLGTDTTCDGSRYDKEGQALPLRVENLPPVKMLAAGARHILVLTRDGEVIGWGHSKQGQVGVFAECQKKRKIEGIPGKVSRVFAGFHHSGVLTDEGAVWVWGNNTRWDGSVLMGVLGIGPNRNFWSTPVPPLSMDGGVVYVSSSSDSNVAIKSDGTVWVWGRNDTGQLGTGNREHQLVPVQIKLPDMP